MGIRNTLITPAVRSRGVVFAVLATMLLCGCAGDKGFLVRDFPADLVAEARSDFQTDGTAWKMSPDGTVDKRLHLILSFDVRVGSDLRDFFELRLLQGLRARGFELAHDAPAELLVCIVKVSEVRKPVRAAKVRLAVALHEGTAGGTALLGVVDGIDPRPDLSSGVSMPKSCYLRAAHLAVGKIILQLGNMPRTR